MPSKNWLKKKKDANRKKSYRKTNPEMRALEKKRNARIMSRTRATNPQMRALERVRNAWRMNRTRACKPEIRELEKERDAKSKSKARASNPEMRALERVRNSRSMSRTRATNPQMRALERVRNAWRMNRTRASKPEMRELEKERDAKSKSKARASNPEIRALERERNAVSMKKMRMTQPILKTREERIKRLAKMRERRNNVACRMAERVRNKLYMRENRSFEDRSENEQLEQNPRAAVDNFLLSSGHHLADAVNTSNVGNFQEQDFNDLCEFYEYMDAKKMRDIVSKSIEKFNRVVGADCRIHVCFSCGIRDFVEDVLPQNYKNPTNVPRKPLMLERSLKQVELLKSEPINLTTSLLTRYEHIDGTQYKGYKPGVLSGGNMVALCQVCDTYLKKREIPPFSLADGYEFGDLNKIPELKDLSPLERRLVGDIRPYIEIVKLKPASLKSHSVETLQSALEGHVISFRQNAIKRFLEARNKLPRLDLHEHMHVTFIGPQKQWDALKKENWKSSQLIQGMFKIRPKIVYDALKFLKRNNPFYAHIEIDESKETALYMETISKKLLESCLVESDETAKNLELVSTANINRSDDASKGVTSFQSVHMADDFDETNPEDLIAKHADAVLEQVPRFEADREAKPMNEFTENWKVLLGAFPYLFPLGLGIKCKGTVPTRLVEKLIKHHSNRFAEDHRLIFLLYDQHMRHLTAKKVTAKVRTNAKCIAEFEELINSPTFVDDLKEAVNSYKKEPTKKNCELLAKLLRCISVVGGALPFTDAEKSLSYHKLIGKRYFFGAPGLFTTISPDDSNSPLAMRLAGFSREVLKNQYDYNERQKIAADNPVAFARAFQRLIDGIWCTLLNLVPSHLLKKSKAFNRNDWGIFGLPLAAAGTFEVQGRGALHCHQVMWCDLLNPNLLKRIAANKKAMGTFSHLMDQMTTAFFSPDAVEKNKTSSVKEDYFIQPVPDPDEEPEAFEERKNRIAVSVQKHKCTPACFKPGSIFCRYAMPRGECSQTGPVQLFHDKDKEPSYDIEPENIQQATKENLFPVDDRKICFEIKRQSLQERWMSEYHPVLTAAARCNTNVQVLGTTEQAESAIHYLFKYITKSTSPSAILGPLYAAWQYVNKYPSTAEDSGASERNTKYLLTRFLNQVNGKKEISSQQAAAVLLGLNSRIASHETTFCFVEQAIHYVNEKFKVPKDVQQNSSESDGEKTDNEGTQNQEKIDIEEVSDLYENIPFTTDSAPIVTQSDGKITCVPLHLFYAYRNKELHFMSFYEWCATVTVRKKKSSETKTAKNETQSNGVGRKPNASFEHESGCEAVANYFQVLRSKFFIPTIAGRRPPTYPGPTRKTASYKKKISRWAQFYGVTFIPWNYNIPPKLSFDEVSDWYLNAINSASPTEKVKACIVREMSRKMTSTADKKLFMNFRTRSNVKLTDIGKTYDKIFDPEQTTAEVIKDGTKISDLIQELMDTFNLWTDSGNVPKNVLHVLDTIGQLDGILSPVADNSFGNLDSNLISDSFQSSNNVFDQISDLEKDSGFDVQDSPADEPFQGTGTGPKDHNPDNDCSTEIDPTLNCEQRTIVEKALRYINGSSTKPFYCILHGAPGTGKSRAVIAICQSGKEKVLCSATTGIASTVIPGCQTYHTLLGLGQNASCKSGCKNVSKQTLAKLSNKFRNAKLLIIDETSMLSPENLGNINARLKMIKGTDLDFGGLGILLVGDYFQLAPVKGLPIYHNGDRILSSVAGKDGLLQFKKFEVFELYKQMRSAEDKKHTSILESCREGKIDMAKISKTYKILSNEDIQTNPQWLRATYIVLTNDLRHAINNKLVQLNSKSIGQPLMQVRYTLNQENLTAKKLQTLYDRFPEISFKFLRGAPAFLTKNINVSRGLANGTQVKLHSLEYETAAQTEIAQNKAVRCKAGQSVTIPNPIAINVGILLDDFNKKSWPSSLRRELMEDGKEYVVVPIKTNRASVKIGKRTVQVLDSFPIELGYAITDFKCQGQTLNLVVVDPRIAPGTSKTSIFHSTIVWLSRVRNAENLRFIPSMKPADFKKLGEGTRCLASQDLAIWCNNNLKQKVKFYKYNKKPGKGKPTGNSPPKGDTSGPTDNPQGSGIGDKFKKPIDPLQVQIAEQIIVLRYPNGGEIPIQTRSLLGNTLMQCEVIDWALQKIGAQFNVTYNACSHSLIYNEHSREQRIRNGMLTFNQLALPAVQIFLLGNKVGGHWVAAARLSNLENLILLDSIPRRRISRVIREILEDCFGNDAVDGIQIVKCDRQRAGSNDCGFHSVANIIELLEGNNIGETRYKNSTYLRSHMVNCIMQDTISAFPKIDFS